MHAGSCRRNRPLLATKPLSTTLWDRRRRLLWVLSGGAFPTRSDPQPPDAGCENQLPVKKGNRDELYKMFRCRFARLSCDRTSSVKRADKRRAMGSNRNDFVHG